MLLTGVIVVLAAVAAVIIVNPFAPTAPAKGVASTGSTATVAVARQDLLSQTQLSATLGYGDPYSVVNQAQGTLTRLPSVGQVISQGQVLYRVDAAPVVLLYGDTPAYRSLAAGADASDVTGADVAELNADLVALGYATPKQIPAGSDEFSWQTTAAVQKLQHHLGLRQTGALSLGQVVFLPDAARITTVPATLGAPAQPGQPVLTATSTTRQVSVALATDAQSEVATGDKVTITLPNNRTTAGVVASVGTVATAGQNGGSATVTALITPTDPAATGTWDQAPVNVTITTGRVSGALVVPIDALLAQPGGGYAVEVVGADGVHHLDAVTLGLFDDADGLVQVVGTSLAVGQQIEVPQI